jgi:peptide deformylase
MGYVRKETRTHHEFVMINPEVLAASPTTCNDEEACLSLPGQKGMVERSDTITVRYMTVDGKIHMHKATGYNARIILHEIDHLDGVLFIDKLV